ncbi:MAG: cytosolic protein [Desulfovibrio sp.]|nr:cytosolic protein [Desulfovibrio sp.]MBI4961092.1 cytosolic protein [Desulfovibrio sp.]
MDDDEAVLAESVLESMRLMAVHYGLWFAETIKQQGLEKALEAEEKAGGQALSLALKRFSDGTNPFLGRSRQELLGLLDTLGKLWLGLDGVWFQAVEGFAGMDGAKRINDACWTAFAPLEASRIKAVLGLPANGGFDALEKALRHRFSSRINEVEILREQAALTLRYTACRVQAARRRKGLADYPCKSAGVAEFTGFARTLDSRFTTTCIACPPDPLPDGDFCFWRFTLEND